MSSIDKLIAEMCPDGVPFRRLGDIATLSRGQSITKSQTTGGLIPVVAGGRSPAYYHDKSNRSGETVVLAGSGAYAGFVSWWDTPIWVSDAFSVVSNGEELLNRYCYHFLQSHQESIHALQSGGGVPHVYPKHVAELRIPTPPLAIQSEIVRILDKFTALEAELEAELSARQAQYQHYRRALLADSRFVTTKRRISELVEVVRPPGKVPRSDYSTSGTFPIIDQGQGRVAAFSDRQDLLISAGEWVLFGDHTRSVKYVDFPFIQGADGLQILRTREHITPRYLYELLSAIHMPDRGYNRHWSVVREMTVDVHEREDQDHIATILQRFQSLIEDLETGLPAELAARRKQYEYYRERLLTFKELEA